MMKNNISIIIFSAILMAATYSMAYDNKTTHKIITETSVPESNMDTYLKQSMGMINGSKEVISGKQIIKWLSDGSYLEDEPPCRRSSHFHTPLPMSYYDPAKPAWSQSGVGDLPSLLDDWCWDWKPRYSNITWATGYLAPPPNGSKESFSTSPTYEPINWDKARSYYYKALTLQTKTDRDIFFTWALKAVGQVLHLLQDVSVPAHVRNDFTSHLTEKNPTNPPSSFIQPFECYVETHPALVTTTGDPVFPSIENPKLTDFWDANLYAGTSQLAGTNIGLAEFTNANYLSDSTILNNHPLQVHTFPYPNVGILHMSSDYQICLSEPSPGFILKYISRKSKGACPSQTNTEAIDYFANVGLLSSGGYPTDFSTTYLELDDNVHNTYAKELLPRAVGYSAGLLNYFFRGTLEVSAPDQLVYAIADGSITPHQFTTIKAKVRNTTAGESMAKGILQAVAGYKKRADYQSDLSTDPPTSSSGVAYSYSVSAPVTITSLDLTTPTEFAFDFTGSPIPAGVTDLYLQVVFKGTLGNETDTAVAVGMKDINEPMHVVVWNATDRFYLDKVLRTAQEIRDNPDLYSRVEGNPDVYIDPYAMTTKLAFTTTTALPATYQVTYAPLPEGRYGRTIILADTSSFYMHVHRESTTPLRNENYSYLYPGVVNQENNGTFENTQVNAFRTIIQHEWTAWTEYYPYPDGRETAPWPAPTEPNPYPATTINQ